MSEPSTPNPALTSPQVALWADQLRDISGRGLHYSDNPYERENYAAIQDIAVAMLAAVSGEPIAELETIRGTVLARPTPYAVGDAAVINDAGEILLIQRADNHLWAMPGGALEVGETPAQGVLREAHEETGVIAEVVSMIGVYDSRLCGTISRHHLYQFLFLCRPVEIAPSHTASHAREALAVGWFAQDELPPDVDPGHITRIPHAFEARRGDGAVFFDR